MSQLHAGEENRDTKHYQYESSFIKYLKRTEKDQSLERHRAHMLFIVIGAQEYGAGTIFFISLNNLY